jgi:hypothetical protein
MLREEQGAFPVPDVEAQLHRVCAEAGADPELTAHLIGSSLFAPRDSRRAAELGKKAWQWMAQYRKNWSNVVKVSQQTACVAIALEQNVGEAAILRRWGVSSVLHGIYAMDRFARSGRLPNGRTLPVA